MNDKNIYIGDTLLKTKKAPISGAFVNFGDEQFYKIANYDQMADFFMTIVSDSDHWMFISSNGSLSAGRVDRNNALFPYYTDDKIQDYRGITGSKTIILIAKDGKNYFWEPFSKDLSRIYTTERNLYKSEYGDKIIFEEINRDLKLKFQYSWSSSDRFGFVKRSHLQQLGDDLIKVEVLDGIMNILPSGVDYNFQNEYSNLLDAYKKNELLENTGLGLFMLSSVPVDKAEPSESLRTTTVWSAGLSNTKILLSNNQLDHFRNGFPIHSEYDIKGRRGAYFVHAELELERRQESEWITVAEVNQNSTDVADLNQLLKNSEAISEQVRADVRAGTNKLIEIVAASDGLQISNEKLCSARHYSNTLFNVMRGGIYQNGYWIEKEDFQAFLYKTNISLAEKFDVFVNELPNQILCFDLGESVNKTTNKDLIRIYNEYLPLTFSRRHGDPSRPWNQFSIENRNEDGSQKLDFQGNWRDIFQNWEALSLSYPGYIEHIISKFVNASTADGYNPYRITRDGIDWESPDPDDPWSYIGYWGDHQIIYLQKLLELSDCYHPGKTDELLTKEVFVYANVPYRIKAYSDIIKDPRDTIEFDFELNAKIKDLVEEIGADGRLLLDDRNQPHYANFAEKILVTLLAKLGNFIPEAGIWLNTQRPEWNDANNALVGNGVSMVTLYYLRRFLNFWNSKLKATSVSGIHISEEIKMLFDGILNILVEYKAELKDRFSDEKRRNFCDQLGEVGTAYRSSVYAHSFSGVKQMVPTRQLVEFMELALAYVDHSIHVNKRADSLYHSYNLISFEGNGIVIRHLYEMLEGQVAVLSAGYLTAEESLEVLNSLKKSKLFRDDQYSYILYPDRELPRFIEKNNIPRAKVKESKLLELLISNNDTSILSGDSIGEYHFSSRFRNVDVLNEALDSLDSRIYGNLLEAERRNIHELYEEMFDHQSFTGRSGTFYAYEGLGSIYWHMVSKLLLATEECFYRAVDQKADPAITSALKRHYFEIKEGIGLNKSPELYGAFPTDAYSHTPANSGVKQPGMTGQVKEDIISRMGELGVRILDGAIVFDTKLINEVEFLTEEKVFTYYSTKGEKKQLNLHPRQLGFTICQKPVVYTLSDHEKITISLNYGTNKEIDGNSIDKQLSSLIFSRSDEVELIEVMIKK